MTHSTIPSAGRIAVTGATSAIGKDICYKLAQQGHELLLLGRKAESLSHLAETLPGQHFCSVVDLNNPDDLYEIIIDSAVKSGPFQGAVHCAGVHNMTPLRSASYDSFEHLYRINCGGALALIKAFTRKKTRLSSSTSIVLISSVSQSVGEAGIAGYAASKAALAALCRCAAVELAKNKVLVNCIAAGMIKTPLNDGYEGIAGNSHFDKLAEEHPLGFGQADDISQAVLYLLDHNRWSTGSTIFVDGGYTCK